MAKKKRLGNTGLTGPKKFKWKPKVQVLALSCSEMRLQVTVKHLKRKSKKTI